MAERANTSSFWLATSKTLTLTVVGYLKITKDKPSNGALLQYEGRVSTKGPFVSS